MDSAQWTQEFGVGKLSMGTESRKVRPQIGLNCPRCQSTNTKFCYYNNYSLSQPRYLCKTCRRYWTEGGTLRNVPVGGGSRKNKRSYNKHEHGPMHHAAPSSSSALDFLRSSGVGGFNSFGIIMENGNAFEQCKPPSSLSFGVQQNMNGFVTNRNTSAGDYQDKATTSNGLFWNIGMLGGGGGGGSA